MSTSVRQVSKTSEVDERNAALVANANAIAALASAVEGTLGPKGLDCMLVDRLGDTTVTNDGATILDRIDTAPREPRPQEREHTAEIATMAEIVPLPPRVP